MELCVQSWHFTNIAPTLYQIGVIFASVKKITISLYTLDVENNVLHIQDFGER